MTDKSKIQTNTYMRNFQDAKAISSSKIKKLHGIFTLYGYEPEPLFINGQCLYI